MLYCHSPVIGCVELEMRLRNRLCLSFSTHVLIYVEYFPHQYFPHHRFPPYDHFSRSWKQRKWISQPSSSSNARHVVLHPQCNTSEWLPIPNDAPTTFAYESYESYAIEIYLSESNDSTIAKVVTSTLVTGRDRAYPKASRSGKDPIHMIGNF